MRGHQADYIGILIYFVAAIAGLLLGAWVSQKYFDGAYLPFVAVYMVVFLLAVVIRRLIRVRNEKKHEP